MGNKVEIKDSKIKVKGSKKINIGVISDRDNPQKRRSRGVDDLLEEAVKSGKFEKIVGTIFIIAIISLVVILN